VTESPWAKGQRIEAEEKEILAEIAAILANKMLDCILQVTEGLTQREAVTVAATAMDSATFSLIMSIAEGDVDKAIHCLAQHTLHVTSLIKEDFQGRISR